MNKHYKNMIYQQLSDGNTYQKTDSKCDNRVMKKVCKLTGKFDPQLTNIFFQKSNFYGCPKVHKSKQMKR